MTTPEGRKLIGSASDCALGLETPAISAHGAGLNALDGPV